MYLLINEEVKIKSNKKIRDAIHDIVINLDKDDSYNLGEICNILRNEYKIYITPDLLNRMLYLWSKKDNNSIFLDFDKKWLLWNNKTKLIKNNFKLTKKRGVLGKSRRRIKSELDNEKIQKLKENGWMKIRDGRFVYNPKTFKVNEDDDIMLSKYEKQSFKKGENPITSELVRKMFILDHPDDADDIVDEIQILIDEEKIKAKPSNGEMYYYECFLKMIDITNALKLDVIRGWDKKYAPTKLQERMIKQKKKKKWEKEENKKSDEKVIYNKDEGLKELKKIVDLNKIYYVVLTKYNKTKKKFYLSKVLPGKFSLEKRFLKTKFFIYLKVKKYPMLDFYFETPGYLERSLTYGLNTKEFIYNTFSEDDIDKVKIYVQNLNRYKGWDEYLDEKTINLLKNDF